MKKFIKAILLILNFILSLIFLYNCLTFTAGNYLTLLFIFTICISIITQFICLDKLKIVKRILFILLNIVLTFISSLLVFIIPAFIAPYSATSDLSNFATLLGIIFFYANFIIFYTYLMVFVNKLKEKGKPKSSFVKLLIFYPLIVTILESLIMFLNNK